MRWVSEIPKGIGVCGREERRKRGGDGQRRLLYPCADAASPADVADVRRDAVRHVEHGGDAPRRRQATPFVYERLRCQVCRLE